MGTLKLYFVALFVFLCIDALWLGVIAKSIYRQQIGFLMADEIRWGAAALFYLLYVAGLILFAVLPSIDQESWRHALFLGGMLGLVCYATYDLTNLATLKDWPLKIVIYDLIWGVFISSATSLIAYFIGIHWKASFT